MSDAGFCPRPNPAKAVLPDGRKVGPALAHTRGSCVWEVGESDAVEANKSFVGSNPKISLPRFEHSGNHLLPFFTPDGPGLYK